MPRPTAKASDSAAAVGRNEGVGADDRPPRVSVGLIVYEGERYLESSIDSYLRQTFTDFELIVSDNGSTDGTERIALAKAAADRRVRYVRSERNRGVAWNLNNAFALARGEYFAWASHDDLQTPEFLERALAVLEADPTVVYAYAPTYLMDDDGRVYAREANRFTLGADSPNRRFWEQLIVRGGQNFWGLHRVSTLQQVGRLGSTPWGERVMFGELSLRGRFAVVPGTSFYWRRQDGLPAAYSPRRNVVAFDPDGPAWRRIRPALLTRYVAELIAAIQRTPLPIGERLRCYARLGRWMLSHVPGFALRDPRSRDIVVIPVDGIDPVVQPATPSAGGQEPALTDAPGAPSSTG